jgi:hypothetical protein
MRTIYILIVLVLLALAVPAAPVHAGGVVAVCDEAHLLTALAGGGTVTFACSGTITLTNTIVIAADTTIDGIGQEITINGNDAVGVIQVNSGISLNLNELTVANGYANAGGGILNYGTLTVVNVTFFDNRAATAGGGIANGVSGIMFVGNSTFWNNRAVNASGGGGGMANSGMATVFNSTFSGNSSSLGRGGGIADFTGGTLTVVNSTFSDNSAGIAGGAISNRYGTSATLKNTVVVGTQANGNCESSITDGGGNLSFSDTTCPGINADPALGPLQNNGGPTWTMALGPGSAAIDAGVDAVCAAAPVNGLDQRGIIRPQGPHCDIGAVEQLPPMPPRIWLPLVHRR